MSFQLLASDFRACFPGLRDVGKQELYRPSLEAAMVEFDIMTPLRAAAFLAQIRHEAIGLTKWAEIGGARASYAPYWGRGPIQLTGLANYTAAEVHFQLPLVANPDLVLQTDLGFRVAGWFWWSHGLNAMADRLRGDGGDREAFDAITKRIHGCGRQSECICRQPRWEYYAGSRHGGRGSLAVMTTPTIVAGRDE